MTSEVWLPVNMEGIRKNMYAVSSKGNLIGSRGRMKPFKGCVSLASPGKGKTKQILAHIIVCTMFHGEKPYPSYTVDHIDQKTKNNDISNLRWASKKLQRANQKRGVIQKGHRVIHRDLSGNIIKSYMSAKSAGKDIGIKYVNRQLNKGSVKTKNGTLEYDKLVPKKNSIIKDIPEWIFPNKKHKWKASSCGLILTKWGWTTGSYNEYYYVGNIGVHRLVAAAFLGKPDDPMKTHVNHKHGKDGKNNNIDNLEWVTPSENSLHSVETGLSDITRAIVKYSLQGTRLEEFSSIKKAKDSLGKKCGSISAACNGKLLQSGGFQWRYLDDNIEKLDDITARKKLMKRVIKYTLSGTRLEEYENVDDAIKSVKSVKKLHRRTIHSACNGNVKQKSAHGFQWRYKSQAPDGNLEPVNYKKRTNYKRRRITK